VCLDLLSGTSPASGPILRAGVVELLVPLDTLTGRSNAPGTLAGYGPVTAEIARQVAAAYATDSAARDTTELAATAAVAGGIVAPAPNIQWRYRVYDRDGTLLHCGTLRTRPDLHTTNGSTEPFSFPGTDPAQDAAAAPARTDWNGQAVARGEDRSMQPGNGRARRGSKARGPGRQRRQRSRRVLRCRLVNRSGPNSRRPEPCPPRQADETARFPNTPLRRWIAARDTTCRAPGCTTPARSCDVDHTIEHADGGPTRHDNLGELCRHHHRLKGEGGFKLEQPEPGHFRWTGPTGRTYDVHPDPP